MADVAVQPTPRKKIATIALATIAASATALVYLPDAMRGIFSTQFLPHVYCYLYNRDLIALHVGSDTAIWASYVAISATLAYLVYRTRRQIPFSWMLLAFGTFIIACGFTHLMEVIVLWKPLYWLAGDVKLLTAVASVITAIALPPLVPKVESMLLAAELSHDRKAQLERANLQLTELSGRLLGLQDEERRRIARELHDSTGQILAALQLHIGMVQHGAACLDASASLALEESARLTERVLADVRTMSYLLHPPLIEEAGLVAALSWFVDGFSSRSKIAVDFSMPEKLARLPRDLEMAVFRIVQEALTNVHRHSDSNQAIVKISATPDSVTLSVRDMGKGMPPGILDGVGNDKLGVGISGMRERVRQLGGTLNVRAENPGTVVEATFPLTRAT